MVSTADSLLILSATELSENLLKSKTVSDNRNVLMRSRYVTAVLAVIALIIAYISPSNLIYNLVGYVWAGIGGTFSIVILFTLFWKKYHGKAVLATIIVGMTFTIIWISSGMEKIITARFLTFVVAGGTAILATYIFPQKSEK
jgi:sodium/proline symporter